MLVRWQTPTALLMALCVDAASAAAQVPCTPTFGPSVPQQVGFAHGSALAVGDFNDDGRLDLATAMNYFDGTANNGAIRILLASAAGGFELPTLQPIGSQLVPNEIATADYDQDGDLDLVLMLPEQDLVSLLLGDGVGGLTPGPIVAAGVDGLTDVVADDFNGDGLMDIAVTAARSTTFPNGVVFSQGMVDVHSGDGTGGFQSHGTFLAGWRLVGIATGDVDGNGRRDLVTIGTHNRFRATARSFRRSPSLRPGRRHL